jgi:hypothetical protein
MDVVFIVFTNGKFYGLYRNEKYAQGALQYCKAFGRAELRVFVL